MVISVLPTWVGQGENHFYYNNDLQKEGYCTQVFKRMQTGNSGYGWTRTTDLSIMSAAL